MRRLLVVFLSLLAMSVSAQKVTLDPTITPALFKYNDPITVTYDVTGTTLANLTDAWIWVWIPNTTINAPTNVNPATAGISAAKFTKSTANGKTLFTLTFKPSDFFASDISTQKQMGVLLKGQDWSNGQTSDYLATFWDGSFQVKITAPTQQPLFVSNGDKIAIEASAPLSADFTVTVDNTLVPEASKTGVQNFSYSLTASNSAPYHVVTVTATASGKSSSASFNYNIRQASPALARPKGIIDGINYNPTDPTKVTLSLWAPGKNSVYAFGDFSDWNVLPANLMNKDGEHFWIEISGLTAGQEYGFQYLVDEKLKVADPYSDKILDPDDQYISTATYPSLKAFPAKALNNDWYYNRVAVIQTGQTSYSWKASNYTRPAVKDLVIYELHIRDFFESTGRNYQNLIDTVGYFKRLGVNAIELMPITEFNGNDSWGYNPTFMFAVDKYYGTKNKLKEFIDKCHQNGIAVILDVVMNHQDIPNPYALMYFDFTTFKPAANNPWFNRDATHPFNVFNDLNHESPYTKKYLDTVNHYWINQFKFDGLRFDLSKGFTQTNNPTNVGAWGNYDASRVAILKRMNDKIKSYAPSTYVILEHFAANSEETELASYGMMPWGNANNAYTQASMGFGSSSDISSLSYVNRGWASPNLVGYMESHDEERIMYKNTQFGNSSGSYTTKDFATGINRLKAVNTLFYTTPGPKMLWQFGELGYDKSINTCTDGITISNDCRISAKPVKWSYLADANRLALWKHIAQLLKLRKQYPVFQSTDFSITSGDALVKQIVLKNTPFKTAPTSAAEMNVHSIANIDVTEQTASISFSHIGTWYDYFNGNTPITVTGLPFTLSLKPGEYHLFTDFQLDAPPVTITGLEDAINERIVVYPNPTTDLIHIDSENATIEVKATTALGQLVSLNQVNINTWDVSSLSNGMYILQVSDGVNTYKSKIIKY